ncbi:carbohydrate-binding protein [Bifidobacterium avesanii]|uniref:Carbohydrate-binding protein n=1 Tax=Bifidobacterium avesanii TaxID=1798157 RepID=A0A7K3TGB1_9BIFI|nr:carbohydrate-binding protein [Bifidobacterium avesanii]KAB8294627.1 carbohydrate-binding protein [Bifidobacterium avesanii]NEG78135.1 carbohydrate-binding protein [Bifidobacterium avesanii]
MTLKIAVENASGETLSSIEAADRAVLTYHAEYQPGDRIRFAVPRPGYYRVRVDDVVAESLVYLTGDGFAFTVPFDDAAIPYNPKAFKGDLHLVSLRAASDEEANAYGNLALNPIDQHDEPGVYPHASANAETRNEPVFFARNAIDGVTANASHGLWPFATWGNDSRDDAEITVEFGRPVDLDEIVLVTRADFPHDNWWTQVDLTFSNGETRTVHMEKSDQPHRFPVDAKGVTWVKVGNLVKADDPSPWAALVQLEAYGRNA